MAVEPGETTSFGRLLRSHREAVGWSQEELAERAGLTVNAISALEQGERRRPYAQTVQRLAMALALSDTDRAALIAAVPRRGDAEAHRDIVDAAVPYHPTAPTPPLPLTPLVGRDDEIAAVGAMLRGDQVRLLTLIGPGGVGKTRLALEVMRALAPDYPDGAAFVYLAALDDAPLVVPAIAQALNVRQSGGQSLHESIRLAVEARRILLLLDNVEHLLAAAVDVSALLAACPRLTVLATSRVALGVSGERQYPIEPLALPRLDHTDDAVGDVMIGVASLLDKSLTRRARATADDAEAAPRIEMFETLPIRARALVGAGLLAQQPRDYSVAEARYEESLPLHRTGGDEPRAAGVGMLLAEILAARGAYDRAEALCEEALSLWRRLGNQHGIVAWAAGQALTRDRAISDASCNMVDL